MDAHGRACGAAVACDDQGRQGAHHALYVALLKDTRRVGRWGLHVGETTLDPDIRFDQHKTGYKASRYVNRLGIRLLPQLFEHFNPLRRWEAVELEPALAEAFRNAGVPRVEGGHWELKSRPAIPFAQVSARSRRALTPSPLP